MDYTPDQESRGGAPPAAVEGEGTLFALLQAAGAVQARVDAALEAVGLSLAKYLALEQLAGADRALTLGDLAGRLRCVRSNVTQLADRLETDGLVRRVDDPADRRAIRAVLTPLGVERHAAGAEAIARLQSDLAHRVAPGDRDALHRALAALR